MKFSIIISVLIILFIGYQCLIVRKEDCPYGSEWSDLDKHKIQLPPLAEQKTAPVPNNKQSKIKREKTKIPKVVIQTNEKKEIPEKMADATKMIIELNPEFDYVYFTDLDAKKFLADHFDTRLIKAYDKVRPGAYKADLFRYCFLWINGGVYIDMGMVGLGELNKILKPDDTFVAPEDNGANSIYNAFMACSPRHPILKEAIEMAVQNIEEENYTQNPLGITGPLLLGQAFENVTGQKVIPGKDYENGVRIIKFSKYNRCESGIIHDNGINILATRYPSYRIDQMWYNTKPHYSEMWKKMQVFAK